MSKIITLICEDCLSRNYKTSKTENSNKRLSLNKYCSTCKIQKIHKESR
ncbi:MAG: 50S ribosomal protein L33 [Mycoplasmoidaceae bacterium]